MKELEKNNDSDMGLSYFDNISQRMRVKLPREIIEEIIMEDKITYLGEDLFIL